MATIKSENWDSVTPPAIPAGWTVDTELVTDTLGAVSSPNAFDYLTANINNAIVPFATWATQDGASGDVKVSCTVNFVTTANNQEFYIFARATGVLADANRSTVNRYQLELTRNEATPGFSIAKYISGTRTAIVGPVGTVAAGTNYRAFLTCHGSTITGQVQRLSDSNWLNSSGVFVTDATGATNFGSVTDTSVAGTGYAGLGFYIAGGSVSVLTDDWLLEDLTVPPPPSTDTVYPVKVFYGGMPQ